MKMTKECDETSMSACCTTTVPNVALSAPAVTHKAPSLTAATSHHVYVNVSDLVLATGAVHSRIGLESSSPPRLTIPLSIQVLRI